jgi:hypothetical protein
VDAERKQRNRRSLRYLQVDKLAIDAGQKAVWLWAIPTAGAIVCLAWGALLVSYRKLNRAKFAVLIELEADLPVPPFTREREIYRSNKRRSLSQIEIAIPGCFALLYAVMGSQCTIGAFVRGENYTSACHTICAIRFAIAGLSRHIHTVGSNYEIRRMKFVRFHKPQDAAIHFRPLWLHHVENKCRRPLAALMHDAQRRIITCSDTLNSYLAFQDGIGIIQHRIDGMRGIPVAC